MNRDELLEKLAMELGEWPKTAAQAKETMPPGFYWRGICVIHESHKHFREDDYLAERERLINKPSWDSHDYDEVRQDKFGEWQGRYIGGSWSRIRDGHMPTGHRWQDTLECRPTLTTSLGASGWDEDRIDIIGSNGNDGLAYSAPAWNGEGLPPVGAECEAVWLEQPDGGSRDFEPVLIKGTHRLGNNCAQIWFCTTEGEDIVMLEGNCSFRPIRSDEDKAVEEMLALDDYDTESYSSGMMSREEFCRAIYRDGYRKLEATQ